MIAESRLVSILWYVGYYAEFPVPLVDRIGGHWDWNRHVMSDAVRNGYLQVFRVKYRHRVLKSLRITQEGLQYLSEQSPQKFTEVAARRSQISQSHNNGPDRILRLHALATVAVMAERIGAVVLPAEKPTLFSKEKPGRQIPYDPEQTYYYSMPELRDAMQEFAPNTDSKSSRLVGVILRGRYCYCIYFSGRSRMYYLQGTEENSVISIQSLLAARRIPCEVTSQVLIGHTMLVALKLSKPQTKRTRTYFSVSHFFDGCYFVTDNAQGDDLLRLIIHREDQIQLNQSILKDLAEPKQPTRDYDAVDTATGQPVILGYLCDLMQLQNINATPYGFTQEPRILCFDYQIKAIQQIVGPMLQVTPIRGDFQ